MELEFCFVTKVKLGKKRDWKRGLTSKLRCNIEQNSPRNWRNFHFVSYTENS